MSNDKSRPDDESHLELAEEIVNETSSFELSQSEPGSGFASDSDIDLPRVDLNTEAGFDKLEDKIRARMTKGPRVRTDPLIGQIFGSRFEIINKVGAGGMGVVYRARQKGMDRDVAIKVLLKEYLTNETAVRRFEREALAVSKLEHPNTVRIYDFGEHELGGLYIAMEYLQGLPLQRMLENDHQLPVRRVVRIVKQICSSLEEAHSKGIIHRDLKPDNVFVGSIQGEPDFAKVLDFGVAKLREGAEGGTLTQHGTIFGTPKYMSPEQCRSHPVDQRSDLYSVGVMMYEMISGRTPFASDNPLAILIMHAQDEVSPMAEVRPDLVVPFEVEELMHRLLEKEADDRPADAREVIEECDRLLEMIPVEFTQVLTYENAEQSGMDYNRSAAYTVRNKFDSAAINVAEQSAEMARDTVHVDQVPLPDPKPQYGSAMLAGGAVLAACAAVVVYVLLQMTPVPASAKRLVPDQWAGGEVPELEADLVTVTLQANVDNVNVVNKANGALLGVLPTADKPTQFQWVREPGRTVNVDLAYGDAAPQTVSFDLGEDRSPPPVEFAALERVVEIVPESDVETVTLTVQANVGSAYIRVSGMDQVWPMPVDGSKREIRVLKGDGEVKVTAEKAGYLIATAAWTPSEDGVLTLTLEEDPNAGAPAEQKVTLTLSVNVGKVSVIVGATGQVFRVPKGGADFPIELAMGTEELELTFERRGYKKQTQKFTPSADGRLAVKLEKRAGRPRAEKPREPAVPRLNPIKRVEKKPDSGIGRIKRLKGPR